MNSARVNSRQKNSLFDGEDGLSQLLKRLREDLQKLPEYLQQIVLAEAAGNDGGDDGQNVLIRLQIRWLTSIEDLML